VNAALVLLQSYVCESLAYGRSVLDVCIGAANARTIAVVEDIGLIAVLPRLVSLPRTTFRSSSLANGTLRLQQLPCLAIDGCLFSQRGVVVLLCPLVTLSFLSHSITT
jgi:hypothetical protein